MTQIDVHQLLHGYRRGHQLLAGSTRLKHKDADIVARLSDLSGSLSKEAEFRPYLTAYPLPRGDFYALAKTWLDRNAPRAGCVVTHTLLIPIQSWSNSRNPHHFADLFTLPSSTNDIERYQVVIDFDDSSLSESAALQSPPKDLSIEFVASFFGEGIRPIVWLDEQNPEDVFWLLVCAIWPSLRRRFSCCTLCLQPRALEDRPFDLMFAPSSIYSRFQKIPRENIIDESSPIIDTVLYKRNKEPWYRDWAEAIFGGHYERNVIAKELKEFGTQMGDDPTVVRKLFLIDDLRRRIKDSPTAAVGLMDVVKSLAPNASQANDYKNDLISTALQAGDGISDPEEALKCYFYIDERFRHTAFSKVSPRFSSELSKAVASWVYEYPEAGMSIGEQLFDTHSLELKSAFAKGIVEGLLKLVSESPEKLNMLDLFPKAVPSIIGNEPLIALGYLRKMKLYESDVSTGKGLSTWIASLTDSDARGRIRDVLLPEIKSDDEAPIAEELLKDIEKKEVFNILETLAKSTDCFTPRKIRQVASEQLAYVYPHYTRKWGLKTNMWSRNTAMLIASSYTGNIEGFRELLQNSFSDSIRKAQVMAAFLEMVTEAQLPYWLREHAKKSSDFLIPLLAMGSDTPPDVAHVLQKVLDEVHESPLAKEVNLADKISRLQDFPFSSKLNKLAMHSAIEGYIGGEIDWEIYKIWQSTDWAVQWMEDVSAWELESLVSRRRFDNKAKLERAWKWISGAPEALYLKPDSLLPSLIENLISTKPLDWNVDFTKYWVSIIRRSSHLTHKSMHLKLCADALKFSFDNERYPLGKLVIESFYTVYVAVKESTFTPNEVIGLFSFFDWDKAKELRKKLINSFFKSSWPPGDLALAVRDQSLLRKIFKRIMRRWDGKKYIEKMLKDLANRNDQTALSMFAFLKELVKNPDFIEPWD